MNQALSVYTGDAVWGWAAKINHDDNPRRTIIILLLTWTSFLIVLLCLFSNYT